MSGAIRTRWCTANNTLPPPLQATLPIDSSSQSASPTVVSQIDVLYGTRVLPAYVASHEPRGVEVTRGVSAPLWWIICRCELPFAACHPPTHISVYAVWLLGKVSMINDFLPAPPPTADAVIIRAVNFSRSTRPWQLPSHRPPAMLQQSSTLQRLTLVKSAIDLTSD